MCFSGCSGHHSVREPIPVKVKDIVGGVQAGQLSGKPPHRTRRCAFSTWLAHGIGETTRARSSKTQKRKRGRLDNGAGTNVLASLKRKKKANLQRGVSE